MNDTTENGGIPIGDTPVFLTISLADGTTVTINLDESGWAKTYADYLRVRSIWTLIRKDGSQPPLMLLVDDGDQPYFVSRHVGMLGSGGSNETIARGIGKKAADGTMTRIWSFDNGITCGGDDVDRIGELIVRSLGPR
jgi:hypothetical protein